MEVGASRIFQVLGVTTCPERPTDDSNRPSGSTTRGKMSNVTFFFPRFCFNFLDLVAFRVNWDCFAAVRQLGVNTLVPMRHNKLQLTTSIVTFCSFPLKKYTINRFLASFCRPACSDSGFCFMKLLLSAQQLEAVGGSSRPRPRLLIRTDRQVDQSSCFSPPQTSCSQTEGKT